MQKSSTQSHVSDRQDALCGKALEPSRAVPAWALRGLYARYDERFLVIFEQSSFDKNHEGANCLQGFSNAASAGHSTSHQEAYRVSVLSAAHLGHFQRQVDILQAKNVRLQ